MGSAAIAKSANFGFLKHIDAALVTQAALAERLFAVDPAACIMRLRLLGETLAAEMAAHTGVQLLDQTSQLDRLNALRAAGLLPHDLADLFHALRKAGNQAIHEGHGSASQALHYLKIARRLGKAVAVLLGQLPTSTKLGPFVPPAAPKDATKELREELDALRQEAEAHAEAHAAAREAADFERELREDYERKVATLKQQIAETEALFDEQAKAHEAELKTLLAAQLAKPAAEQQADAEGFIEAAQKATDDLDLTEAETRGLIDAQLREAGWHADTVELRYSRGARPQKGKNLAIAEWPTESGPADYALFLGLRLVGIVEAKRQNQRVVGAIAQAERYARGVRFDGEAEPPGGPWEDGDFLIPFVFATNGRPYLKQLVEESGIWFRDVRRPGNFPRALAGWPSPEGLTKRLAQDLDAAHAKLEQDPLAPLGLRDYQEQAIRAAEQAIAEGRRELLLAMATGTGKTRTCIGLVYRLLKAGVFHRVLFVVDRSALGHQAGGAFQDVKVDQGKTFGEIFGFKGLDDDGVETDTKLHIATIQSLVRQVLYAADDVPPPVDTYDCIVIDECHRGYLLDREMSDAELTFRDEADYISKYRRVLEHFDAVKIGLTATPALHTREIFGDPVFTYSYPEAVIDGYLVDHEPPIRIVTALAKDGITFQAGEKVATYSRTRRNTQLWLLPDDVEIEVEGFNKRVITENFNRVVCEELVRHIDLEGDEKTLVFCVDARHCRMLSRLLKEAFEDYLGEGEVRDDAIQVIIGAVDRPLERLRRFKNEKHPAVAITVDLLTTGVDVPAITNLVFLRRVRSRILYEQMLGRATRLCPEIDKEVFRIYDAVDLYAALQDVTDMKPVATTRKTTFVQLAGELETLEDAETRDQVRDELLAKLARKKRHLREGELAEQFEQLAGCSVDELSDRLKKGTSAEAATYFEAHPHLAPFLDKKVFDEDEVLISDHEDELVEVSRGYGEGRDRPEDYLDSFAEFVRTRMNEIPALAVVTQRPRELTREQLKALKLALDQAGYDEPALRTAWRQKSNVDIAASIVGYIRQAALGDPLKPYEQRVDEALARILAQGDWDVRQKKWLKRIAEQMKANTVVDRAALDRRPFSEQGGFRRIDKIFDGKLEALLGDLAEAVWKEGA